MAKTWKEVEQSESYKKLSSDEKTSAKKEYWDTVVSGKEEFQSLEPTQQSQARQEFFGKAKINYGEQARDIGLDVASKMPGVGGVATAGLGNVFEALKNPMVRGIAEKTAIPLTATMTGQLPAYLGYQVAEKVLPRPEQIQGLNRIPQQGVPPEIAQAMALVKPELSGIFGGLQQPQQTIKTGLSVAREFAKFAAAGGVQSLYKSVGNGFKSINPKNVKITAEEIAKLKVQGINVKDKIALNKLRVEKAKIQTLNTWKQNNSVLENKLQEDIVREVPKMKEGFSSYMKGFNDTYGNSLDDISENIGQKITNKDGAEWINGVIKRLESNPQYAETDAINKVSKLRKLFSGSRVTSPILDARGKPITKIVESDTKTFKEIHAKVKEVLSGRVYDGKADVNNLVYDEVRHSWGDFIAKYDSGFAKLQAEASKVLNIKRFGSKIFKPYSQYDTKKLEDVIMKNARGKASGGEQTLLKDVYKLLGDSGIDTKGIDNLARRIATGKVKLSQVDVHAKLLINKIQRDAIKNLSPIKQKELMQSAIMKGQKHPSKLKAITGGVGKVIDVAWRVLLYRMLRGGL